MLKKVLLGVFLLVLPSFLLCTGCSSEPTVDTSNDQAFVKSMAEIYKVMPEADKADFGKYFLAAMKGKISSFSPGKSIKEDEYDDLYLLVKMSGDDDAAKYFDAINGLTAAQIQEKGAAIWKSFIEARLAKFNEDKAKYEVSAQKFIKYAEEQSKVTVEIGDNIEAEPSSSRSKKHTVASLTFPISIHNGSSLRLIMFEPGRDTFSLSDENGNAIKISPSFKLLNENGKLIFDRMYGSEGIAPGATVKGTIIADLEYGQLFSSPEELPYPLTRKIVVNYKYSGAVLEGFRDISDSRTAASELERVKKEIEETNAELTKLTSKPS